MHVFAPLLWLSFFGSAAGFAGGFAPAAGADAEADPESSVRGMDCTIASASSSFDCFAFPALRANASASEY